MTTRPRTLRAAESPGENREEPGAEPSLGPAPRVLVAGPTPPPTGGIATMVRTIVASPLRDRYAFEIFSTSQVRFHPHTRLGHWLDAGLSRALGFDGAANLEARAKRAVWRRMLDPAPALVHLNASHGYDFWLSVRMASEARRRGIPSLLHVHGNFDVMHPRWSRVRRAAFRSALRVPDRLIVLSEYWRRWFGRFLSADRISVVPNCVDVRRFRPRWDRGATRESTQILFVGTGDPMIKGAYDVVAIVPEVARAASGVRFQLVGPDVEQIEERLVRGTPLAPHVEFTGWKSAEEIVPFFEEADVFLLPSHMEALPVALLEAMAAGLPAVASRVTSVPEVLGGGEHGILVAPGDRNALAQGVLELVRDPERRLRMGRANRARAEASYDVSRFAAALGDVYRQTMRDHHRHRRESPR